MATIRTDNAEPISSGINRICEGTKIVGTIETSGDIRIDGTLEGSVFSKGRVVVGEAGKIKGDFNCTCLDVSGKIDGKINAKDILTLKDKSVVTGEIIVQKLVVESGAIFNGTCKMGTVQAAQPMSTNTTATKQ